MLPLDIFGSRQFNAANLVTFAVYAALGGVLLLAGAAAAGGRRLLSRSRPGIALLPVTVVMLLLSARMGALAQRIGPRLPMTVGPLRLRDRRRADDADRRGRVLRRRTSCRPSCCSGSAWRSPSRR